MEPTPSPPDNPRELAQEQPEPSPPELVPEQAPTPRPKRVRRKYDLFDKARMAVVTIAEGGDVSKAARRLGMPRRTVGDAYRAAMGDVIAGRSVILSRLIVRAKEDLGISLDRVAERMLAEERGETAIRSKHRKLKNRLAGKPDSEPEPTPPAPAPAPAPASAPVAPVPPAPAPIRVKVTVPQPAPQLETSGFRLDAKTQTGRVIRINPAG